MPSLITAYETEPSLESLLESCGQAGNTPLIFICLSSTLPTLFHFSPHFCFPGFALPVKVLTSFSFSGFLGIPG